MKVQRLNSYDQTFYLMIRLRGIESEYRVANQITAFAIVY